MICWLCSFFKCITPREDVVFRFALPPQSYIEGTKMRLTTEQQVSVTVVAKTAAGHDAKIDGDVVFASSNAAIATVTSTGPNAATVVATGPGGVQITAEFDADLGAGTRSVLLSGVIEVVEAEADTGELTFGTPALQP